MKNFDEWWGKLCTEEIIPKTYCTCKNGTIEYAKFEEEIESGIYAILFPTSNKLIYIGKAKDLKQRIAKHITDIGNTDEVNEEFNKAIKKYGQNYKVKILVNGNFLSSELSIMERDSIESFSRQFSMLNRYITPFISKSSIPIIFDTRKRVADIATILETKYKYKVDNERLLCYLLCNIVNAEYENLICENSEGVTARRLMDGFNQFNGEYEDYFTC